MSEWEEARRKEYHKVKEIEKTIKSYNYSNKAHAHSTNDKILEFLLNRLRESKKTVFDIIDIAYSQQKDFVVRVMEKIRDDMDILIDKIKTTHFDWLGLPENLISKIIEHDLDMIKLATRIDNDTEWIREKVLETKRESSRLFDREDQEALQNRIHILSDEVNELLDIFIERAEIFNLDVENLVGDIALREL